MGSFNPMYHSDVYVKRRMGETREKGKEYNLTLSCIFDVVDCLKGRLCKETMGQVGKLVSIEIPSKQVVPSE
jgi:hypothetical protein